MVGGQAPLSSASDLRSEPGAARACPCGALTRHPTPAGNVAAQVWGEERDGDGCVKNHLNVRY